MLARRRLLSSPARSSRSGLSVRSPMPMSVSKSGAWLVWLLLAFAALCAPRAQAQFGTAGVEGALYAKRVGEEVRVVLELEIPAGFHIYHHKDDLGHPEAAAYPTSATVTGEGFVFEPVVFPTPHRAEQEGLGTWVWEHTGTVRFHAKGAGPATAELTGIRAAVDGQVCDPNGCEQFEVTFEAEEPPKSRDVFADWDKAMAAPKAPTPAPEIVGSRGTDGAPEPAPQPSTPDQPLGAFLLAAIFWGLFALVMPCTYPMIPITISFFTKQASARHSSSLGLSFMYGLGIVAIFVLIGLLFGSVIIPFATHPVTNLLIGAVFVVFAFSLFGAFTLEPPRFLLNAAGSASSVGGVFGVFLMGATLAVTSFTCTAPFVGTLLATGAQGGNLARIAIGMATFGATMAVPFVILSLVPGKLKSMPRSGEWMHSIKVFLGFVELAAALKFLSNADVVWDWAFLSRELFLFLWFGTFLAAALYLFGVIRLQGDPAEVSPTRMSFGVATLLFAIYCLYGALGNGLDRVMTALAPPYSNTLVGAVASDAGSRALVIKDDYDAARAEAIARGVPLFLNFTGHTCVNCRQMELTVFPRPEVAIELEKVVEARLHTDGRKNIEQILELQKRFTQSRANPYYLVIDSKTEQELSRLDHAVVGDPEEFVEFLQRGLSGAKGD
ncbi:MAG: hypothetical protein EPO68_04165 [Planctomycetota bacterium]|nr:MAG: hypothetical protein EPO68_04165 [Planctomycetota bacterium]